MAVKTLRVASQSKKKERGKNPPTYTVHYVGLCCLHLTKYDVKNRNRSPQMSWTSSDNGYNLQIFFGEIHFHITRFRRFPTIIPYNSRFFVYVHVFVFVSVVINYNLVAPVHFNLLECCLFCQAQVFFLFGWVFILLWKLQHFENSRSSFHLLGCRWAASFVSIQWQHYSHCGNRSRICICIPIHFRHNRNDYTPLLNMEIIAYFINSDSYCDKCICLFNVNSIL